MRGGVAGRSDLSNEEVEEDRGGTGEGENLEGEKIEGVQTESACDEARKKNKWLED